MNPFFILAGALMMAIFAMQGGVSVSGFTTAAQDVNVQSDLSSFSVAQSGYSAMNSVYAPSVAALSGSQNGISTMFQPTSGVLKAYAVNAAGTSYVFVEQSASGKYFAKTNTQSGFGSGATLAAALTAAGATSAWATANNVTLPTAVS